MVKDDIASDNSDSFGSLVDEELETDVDDDEALQDNWAEELECALLAECDPATLRKICEGKKIPSNLRPDYWRTLLALDDSEKIKLTNEYDLPYQAELRHDCQALVEDILSNISLIPLSDPEKCRLRDSFESTLTTYLKARPELKYTAGNGWTDILKVLHSIQLSDIQMYQMFFRIVDRYIPRDLSSMQIEKTKQVPNDDKSSDTSKTNPPTGQQMISSNMPPESKNLESTDRKDPERSVQAYHLLRLLIQYHDPELCSILDSKKVTPSLYVKDWFASLFARSCPLQLTLHIWDMHFKMADPFLIFFAAIVMVVNAGDNLKRKNMNQRDMLDVLKVMPSKLEEDDIEDLYYLVSNHYTYLTPRSIRSYSHLFFMDTFGNTYSGNESPDCDGSPTFVDFKTTKLTSSIDLSQYLCLPIVPAEIFALETAKQKDVNSSPDSSPTNPPSSSSNQPLRYFLVDCRPAEQYNAGHLNKAFHLDCSLMLREPSSFATAVQALLEIQKQVVASKSSTGGKHLCFIGSGQEEEDQYVNMVVASFLQKYQKYVSIVLGGFEAIHNYVKTKSELCNSFDKYIVEHNDQCCKACCSAAGKTGSLEVNSHMSPPQSLTRPSNGLSSSFLATTSSFFKGDKATAQSGASIFDKFTTAFVSKSNVLKDRLVETINNNAIPNSAYAAARSHVSSQDKLGPRYMGSGVILEKEERRSIVGGRITRLDDAAAGLLTAGADHLPGQSIDEEPCQEIQIDTWQRDQQIIAIYKCAHIKGANRYPGFVALNKTHLWILREIPHNKGFASIAAKRPLDMIIQITSKRKQPDFIIFRYGYPHNKNSTKPSIPTDVKLEDKHEGGETNCSSETPTVETQKGLPTVIASDNLHIPQAFEVIRLIKHEIVRIMDEASRKPETLVEDSKEVVDKPNT